MATDMLSQNGSGRLLDVTTAASMLGLPKSMVRALIREGVFVPIDRPPGCKVLIPAGQLDAVLTRKAPDED